MNEESFQREKSKKKKKPKIKIKNEIFPRDTFLKFLFLFEMLPVLTTCKNFTITRVQIRPFLQHSGRSFWKIIKLFGFVANSIWDLMIYKYQFLLAMSFQYFYEH